MCWTITPFCGVTPEEHEHGQYVRQMEKSGMPREINLQWEHSILLYMEFYEALNKCMGVVCDIYLLLKGCE